MDVEFDNNIPIYIQLVDYLKTCILSGKIKSGDKLPSVRELSSTFKVNPNTMQKALMELEDLGLIYTERTNGKFVTEDERVLKKMREEHASLIIKEYFANMSKIGIDKKEAIDYLIRKDDK